MRKYLYDFKVTDRSIIWDELLKAEKNARSQRLNRFLRKPLLYTSLMAFDYLIYPVLKKGLSIHARTFFGVPLKVLLPSGTDIVLNAVKSHDSEIRLSKFLTLQLQEGDVYVDVGAHHGYYSALASVLVGPGGKVYSIEPSSVAYELLNENSSALKNITTYQAAAGDHVGEFVFYEYPGPYAEYNTIVKSAYENEAWAKNIKPVVTKVQTIVLDDLFDSQHIEQAIIKIDVEGGEPSVLRGMSKAIAKNAFTIVMEYLLPKGGSSSHEIAADMLYRAGYQTYAIRIDGALDSVVDISAYMQQTKISSDNIVFLKT